jgi:hypothetical protein
MDVMLEIWRKRNGAQCSKPQKWIKMNQTHPSGLNSQDIGGFYPSKSGYVSMAKIGYEKIG